MDFLGFTVSVWAAVLLGVFFLALVLSCTFDRSHNSSPKWVVLVVGLLVFAFIYRKDLSIDFFFGATFWKGVGVYLLIGLVYSIMEFIFAVRREERQFRDSWKRFKSSYQPSQQPARPGYPPKTMAQEFVDNQKHVYRTTLVGLAVENDTVVPVINRSELAQSVFAWSVLWPGYAISLILGDLMYELAKKFADFLALISSRAVRGAFSRTFE